VSSLSSRTLKISGVIRIGSGSGLNMGPQNGSETGLTLNVINALITLPIPTTYCRYPRFPTTICCLPSRPAATYRYLLPPIATSPPHHFRLPPIITFPPTTTCSLPPLPTVSHRYLLPPATTRYLPPLPAASHHYLLPPATTCFLPRLLRGD